MADTDAALMVTAPFDCEEADLIVRSSDGVDFRVFKAILSMASPLLLSRIRALDGEANDELRILSLPYSGHVLDQLLRLIYPIEYRLTFASLAEMRPLLTASVTLEVAVVTSYVRDKLDTKLIAANPIGAYALAVVHDWRKIGQKAAECIKDLPNPPLDSPELDDIPASAYLSLRRYLRRSDSPKLTWSTVRKSYTPEHDHDQATDGAGYIVPSLFCSDEPSDIILRSCDGAEFHVLKTVLSLSSPFFRQMFSLPQDPSGQNIVTMEEDAETLGQLLQMWYPVAQPNVSSLTQLRHVLRSALKYDVHHVVEHIEGYLQVLMKVSPLWVYAVACLPDIQLEDVAAKAAREALRHKFEDLDAPELAYIPAIAYKRLETYVENCRSVIGTVIEGDTPANITWIQDDPVRAQALASHTCARGSWFAPYMREAKQSLRERPGDIEAVMLRSPALLSGACGRCLELANLFVCSNDALAKAITDKLDTVPLKHRGPGNNPSALINLIQTL